MYLVELEQNINEWFYFDDQNNISRREDIWPSLGPAWELCSQSTSETLSQILVACSEDEGGN